MENNGFLVDKGLFNKKADLNFHIPDSYEAITNLLTTIKEYRLYSDPESSVWMDYIREFYHLMGFSIEDYNKRLILLREMGVDNQSFIVVGISLPNEDPTMLSDWLEWKDFLKLSARAFNFEWTIWTNGIELKIFNFSRNRRGNKYFWANLEKIIDDQSDENFFTLYKIFYYLRNYGSKSDSFDKVHADEYVYKSKSKPNRVIETKKRDISINRPNREKSRKRSLKKTPRQNSKVHPSLQRIFEIYYEMTKHSMDISQACEEVAKKNGILTQTVRQDLATRTHLNTEKFSMLVEDKERLISHLQLCFPKNKEEIRKRIS